MVGCDEVDRSIAEGLPQLFAVFAVANWRGALEERRAFGNCFGGEVQIVRTGFNRYGQTFGAGGAQIGKSCAGGKVDYVESEFKFAAEREEHSNRGEFGFFGAGLKISFVERPIGVRQICGGGIDWSREFCVDEEWQAWAGNVRQGGA